MLQSQAAPLALDAPTAAAVLDQPSCIVGSSALLPAGVASLELLWRMSANGQCVGGEVPASRWSEPEGVASAPAEVVQRLRHGGFLQQAAQFDNRVFGISPAEAGVLDPPQPGATSTFTVVVHSEWAPLGAKRCVGVRFRRESKTRHVPSADAVAIKAPVLSTSIHFTGALWHWRAASFVSVRSPPFQVTA